MKVFLFYMFLFCNYILSNVLLSSYIKNTPILFPSKDKILVLSSLTFEEALNTYQYLAVLMYAPWCRHCKELLPELQKAAESKIVNDMNLTFAKIDVDYHSAISDKYNIRGFPTIIFFVNGKKKEIYNGKREMNSIIEWFYKRLVNPIHLIESINDIKEYENSNQFNYIYFGKNQNNINIYKNLSLKQNFRFGLCQNIDIINAYKIAELESAIFYTPFYEPSYAITKNITSNNLVNLIKENRYPLIYKDIKDLFFSSLNSFSPAFFFFRNLKDPKSIEYDLTMKKIALKYKGKIKFSIGDINDSFTQKILNNSKIVINDDNSPIILIFDFDQNFTTWIFDDFYGHYNEINLNSFIENWIAKKLAILKLKSEEDPGKQEYGKVYKVTYKTFKRDVLNNKLNVFAKFYMPNDTKCKDLEPIYEDLALKLKINRNIRIAEYNLEKNYFDFIKIEHYPTLVLFRAGLKEKNELIEYKGNYDVNDMIYFVLTNQAFPILNKKKKKKIDENIGNTDL